LFFQQPAYVWSEEFQTEVFSRHFKAFDELRKKGWFIGEFVWNFADFKTALPFEAEVTDLLNYGAENRITVMCDNALIQTTVPQGRITEVPNDGGMTIVQSYTFDFFNYAGIHRSVHLYTTPRTFIEEVEVTTNLSGDASGKILEFIIRESTEISGMGIS